MGDADAAYIESVYNELEDDGETSETA